ncbi:DUF4097 family beta strand repeat-containing protein [Streptomyces huiliensis]|uniref:DUF4097 family beta strand repeat-containing protein n=1 Tax=Streptomyces huiliensis TaxID=2876027 RepID=UPI001CBBE84F|nr:DUF4097 domain-containing protein [Streptomyces huiliensis]MBZ4322732.1 DUF4097 domain-containing protein [Streptomyces huiliensis]
MPTPSEWSLTAPENLTFEEPVTSLEVRLANGAVNIVGTDTGPARLELSAHSGAPLLVTHKSGALTVGYEDLAWKSILSRLARGIRHRSVTVTLAVPTGTRVRVGVVGAHAVVSGVSGATDVRSVTGNATLVGLTGTVRAETVSGDVEAQSLSGTLRHNSVSGDLTLVDCRSEAVKSETVTGGIVIDLAEPESGAPGAGPAPSLDLTTVSGDVALRLPGSTDAAVEAGTATGAVSNAFGELRPSGEWAGRRLTGRLGRATGLVRVTSVSGAIAVLRRPPAADAFPDEHDGPDQHDEHGAHGGSDAPDAPHAQDAHATPAAPADAPTQGKVL